MCGPNPRPWKDDIEHWVGSPNAAFQAYYQGHENLITGEAGTPQEEAQTLHFLSPGRPSCDCISNLNPEP